MAATTSVIEAAEAADAEAAARLSQTCAPDQGLATTPSSPLGNSNRSPMRLVVVGGAGVMARSSGAFVTETLPGSAVQRLLPIYGTTLESILISVA